MSDDQNHTQVDTQPTASLDSQPSAAPVSTASSDMDTLVLPTRTTPNALKRANGNANGNSNGNGLAGTPSSSSFAYPQLNVVANAPQRSGGGEKARLWIATHKLLSIVLVVLLVLAIGAAAAAYHFRDRTPTVSLYTVHMQTLSASIGAGGLTTPIQTLNIVYPVTATVLNVPVQVGSSVKKGTTLLQVDSADLQRQLATAEGALTAAQITYNNSPTAAAAAALTNAEAQVNAVKSLLNSATYHNGNIIAPFNGVVTAINVANGTTTVPNSTLLTMVDPSSVVVKAQFPLQQRSLIQVGQAVDVFAASDASQHYPGSVTAINVVLTNNGSDTFEVDVTVPNPALALFVGESVYSRIGIQQSLLAVPELAVLNPDADSSVFVYSGGRAHLHHVSIGLRAGDQIGILNGLQDGDQVILVGQYQLTDNEKVNVRGGN